MKIEELSGLFQHGGLIVSPTSSRSLLDLECGEIVRLFEHHGVLLFRGFNLAAEGISSVTDLYTESYANDALRRKSRFGQAVVHNVDYGNQEILLHSEASFSPVWPEIIWLYCSIPPNNNGTTTLCDSIQLWRYLSAEAKGFFLTEPVSFQLEIPAIKKRLGKGSRPWVNQCLGTQGYLDWDTGTIHLNQLRWAVQNSRFSDTLCFANHLLIELDSEPQIISRTMASGKEIPENISQEIRQKANILTYELEWKSYDLLMVDNRRFMHGRRAYDGDARDIVIVQTARASFGFAVTTRQKIEPQINNRGS